VQPVIIVVVPDSKSHQLALDKKTHKKRLLHIYVLVLIVEEA
jgi:hypothetical protein